MTTRRLGIVSVGIAMLVLLAAILFGSRRHSGLNGNNTGASWTIVETLKLRDSSPRRCSNVFDSAEFIDGNSAWTFQDGESGYPAGVDAEWKDIRNCVCGSRSPYMADVNDVSTTLLNRKSEVPYTLPPQFLIVCANHRDNVFFKRTRVRGALFLGTRIFILSKVDLSHLLVDRTRLMHTVTSDADREGVANAGIWLWVLDADENFLLSPSWIPITKLSWTAFREPNPQDVLRTFLDDRLFNVRKRSWIKHADLMPRWGCPCAVVENRKDATNVSCTINTLGGTTACAAEVRGMFRGQLRLAGELYVFQSRWQLDSDSSFAYYRSDKVDISSSASMQRALKRLKTKYLDGATRAPVDVRIFPKSVLFPSDVHVTLDRKIDLIRAAMREDVAISSNDDGDHGNGDESWQDLISPWEHGHRFDCFRGCACTILRHVGHGSSGAVYLIRASLKLVGIPDVVVNFEDLVVKVFRSSGIGHARKGSGISEAAACLHVGAEKPSSLLQRCLWSTPQDTPVSLLFSAFESAEDLDALVSRRDSSLRENDAIGQQFWTIAALAAEALAEVHRRGTIHNDVNPRNMLLVQEHSTEKSRVVLVDFGLAAPMRSANDTKYRSPVYAAAYASPEQHSPLLRPNADGSSDVWSLALSLLHVWTGRVFWPPVVRLEIGTYEWTEQSVQSTIAIADSFKTLPADAREIFSRCLSLNGNDRPTAIAVAKAFWNFTSRSRDETWKRREATSTWSAHSILKASHILSTLSPDLDAHTRVDASMRAYAILKGAVENLRRAATSDKSDVLFLGLVQLGRVHEILWKEKGDVGGECFFAIAATQAYGLATSIRAESNLQERQTALDRWIGRHNCPGSE